MNTPRYAELQVTTQFSFLRGASSAEELFETAAAMMLQGLTVQYLFRSTYPLQAGQTILFHAAAGGVGLIACQWARAMGVQLIGTVGSKEKGELALAHGAAHVINYNDEDIVAKWRKLHAILAAENNPQIEYADLRFADRVIVKRTDVIPAIEPVAVAAAPVTVVDDARRGHVQN